MLPVTDENSIVYQVCINASIINTTCVPMDATKPGKETSVLCVPIMGIKQVLGNFVSPIFFNIIVLLKSLIFFTIGAIQFSNKLYGPQFTANDENICKTFTVYSALALQFSKQSEKMSSQVRLMIDKRKNRLKLTINNYLNFKH